MNLDKLIIAQTICLLGCQIALRSELAMELATEVLTETKIPEASIGADANRTCVIGLRGTIQAIVNGTVADIITLKQRVRMNTVTDEHTFNIINTTLELTDTDVLNQQMLVFLKSITSKLKEMSFLKELKAYASKTIFSDSLGEISVHKAASELALLAEKYTSTTGNDTEVIPGVVGCADFNDETKIAILIEETRQMITSDAGIRSGWQAYNRMLGVAQKHRLGDQWVLGALQYNFKSGLCLNLARHAVVYNKPVIRKENKQPAVIHISTENHLNDNIMLLYRQAMGNHYKKDVDITTLDVTEVAKWVSEYTSQNGFKLLMYRVNPSSFGYRQLYELLDNLDKAGYDVQALFLDYLNMLSKEGCIHGHSGIEVRDLFRRVRNRCSEKGILFWTPHQISKEATQLLRNGTENFLEQIANRSYWDSCKAIDQEVDGEIYINKEVIGGRAYLMFRRGKHRNGIGVTPEKDLAFIMPFNAIGDIHDDIEGEDISLAKIPRSSSAANPEADGTWLEY